MTWTIKDAAEAFQGQRRLWDELNAASANHILLDSRFVAKQLRHFASQPVMLAVDTSSSSPAMALLVTGGHGRWNTFQPSQQPLGNLLLVDSSRAEAQISELVRSLPGYALLLSVLCQDPDVSRLPLSVGAEHLEVLPQFDTGRITLGPDFDQYWQQRPDDLRESVARRRRRLERESTLVRLVALREPAEMAVGMRDYSRMEEAGWKAAEGTAVSMDNAQGAFYLSMMQALCETGEATIYQLLFNDWPVASQICVGRGRMSVSLKITFDERFRRDAPGYLLQEQIIHDLHCRPGVEVIEFYGRASDGWTRKWTSQLRTMHHLNVYRSGAVRRALLTVKVMLRKRGGLATAANVATRRHRTGDR